MQPRLRLLLGLAGLSLSLATGSGCGGALSAGPAAPAPDAGPDATSPAPLALGAADIARRLSLLLWERAPDATLLAGVYASPPANKEDVRRLALAMLKDDRARAGVGSFYRIWLRLDSIPGLRKDPDLLPGFTSSLAAAMAAEPESFGVFVTLDGDQRYPTLMTAPFSFVNEELAGVYGLTGVSGPELRRTMLDGTQRAGLLTQPGLLAMTKSTLNASASARGAFIQHQVLCAGVPTPSGESVGEPPPDMTNRQWIEAAAGAPGCRPCHDIIDPIGYGLGTFDAIGRFQTVEHGMPVDASGAVAVPPGGFATRMPFDGSVELAALLARLPEAQSCFAKQWLRHALGREVTENDAPSLADVQARFQAADLSIPALIAAVAASDAFLAPP